MSKLMAERERDRTKKTTWEKLNRGIVAASSSAGRGPGTGRANLRFSSSKNDADCSDNDDAAIGEAREGPKSATAELEKRREKN